MCGTVEGKRELCSGKVCLGAGRSVGDVVCEMGEECGTCWICGEFTLLLYREHYLWKAWEIEAKRKCGVWRRMDG